MAMYVVLQFPEDAEAKAFIDNLQATKYVMSVQEDTGMRKVFPSVRGLFKKPTLFCKCMASPKKGRGFTRGKKYGWWVCTLCGKPTLGWARGEHWFLALGRNLLPISEEAPEYRGDGVFQTHIGRKECPDCKTGLKGQLGLSTAKVWCPKCEKSW